MKIRDMELLVRIGETGSMTRAAQQLQLTPAAVSAAVQRMEAAIGVRLFERTTRTLQPTDEGLRIIEGCEGVVEGWQRALDDVRGEGADIRGTVHLSAPADTTYQLLDTAVVELCAEHPALRVVVHSSDAVQHLHREAIDIAIRYGPLQDSTLTARKLASCPEVLVAAPAYLAAKGVPKTLDALSDHRCLTLQRSSIPVDVWALHRNGTLDHATLHNPLCGDGYLVRKWAVAGHGIALKSLLDVISDLEAGRLVRVLPEYAAGPSPIHAVFPSRRFLPTRVRALDASVTKIFETLQRRCEVWLHGAG